MVIITLYNSKILLSLHYFLVPQFQTLNNLKLLIRIFGVSNPIFKSFLRNYVSIIVNIISNKTALQRYLLWIFVSIRRLLQLIVCISVSIPLHLKNNLNPSTLPIKKKKKSDFSVNSHNIKIFYH